MAESEHPADLSASRAENGQKAAIEAAGEGTARGAEACEPLGPAAPLAQHTSVGATLAALCMLAFPGAAGVTTTVLYLSKDTSGSRALLFGTLIGLAAWLLLAWVLKRISSPRGAVPTAWAQLDEERTELRARFDRLLAEEREPSTILPEARRAILAAEAKLNAADARADWIVAVGYVAVWRHLHRADEAMMEASSTEDLIAAASRDYLRVAGSTMPQAPTLAKMIAAAANALQPGALAPVGGPAAAAGAAADAVSKPVAPHMLRQARRAINDFRDGSRMGLVRARNALVLTIGATGVLAYLLFGLALLAGATRDQIAAGAAFYVVAGLVGLFRQLQLASARDTVSQEDFGLQAVRLIHTPLFSGIAGVAGVVLTKLVTDASNINLARIFDVQANPLGLVIAAVFGLTPHLLISQLHAKAESYKSDLKNTEAGQGAAAKPQ